MDVRHYFESVDFSKYSRFGPLKWSLTVGAGIEKTMQTINPDKLERINIAIIGIPYDIRTEDCTSKAPDLIRKELYQLANIHTNTIIADFGNLKISKIAKENYKAVRDLVEYFNDFNIITLILGGSQDLTIGICDAFRNNPFSSLSVVDSCLDIKKGKEPLNSKNFLSQLFRQNPDMFQFNLIGYQSYFVPSAYFSKTPGINQHLRLGLIRDNIKSAEPILRNSNVISVDITSVKSGDMQGSVENSPNGLRSEEVCQLARYAGIANSVKVFGIFENDPDYETSPLGFTLASQILWYFIEGFSNRTTDNVRLAGSNTVYRVEVENVDHPITFIRDIQTGQWWIEVSTIDDGKHYFACSEQEYLQAKNNEIPELWLKYVQKTDRILK